jgi:mannobiose 2-epimerase
LPDRRLPEAQVPSCAELEHALWRHVLEPWFPRCIDHEHGGFLCDFDHAWNAVGPHLKLAEFQARQTWTAAEAARRYPEARGLREAALHGFEALAGMMWDRAEGGWFHCTDRAGRPLWRGAKHTHVFAYAIPACLAVHALTGEAAPRALAYEAFLWLDHHAHDREHGGYFGMMARDGRPLLAPSETWPGPKDTLGTPLGCKDSNVQTDVLECLTEVAAALPDGPAPARLAAQIEAIDRMTAPDGVLGHLWTPDWRRIDGPERIGYCLQGASGLVESSPLRRVREVARRLLERGFTAGFDAAHGGFFEFGQAPGQPNAKVWWLQWEALSALACFGGEDWKGRDRARFAELWAYIRRDLFDEEHGGCGWFCRDSAPAGSNPKGTIWKDASHEARNLLYCLARLEKLEGGGV